MMQSWCIFSSHHVLYMYIPITSTFTTTYSVSWYGCRICTYVHMNRWAIYIYYTHIYLWQIHHRSTYYSLVPWIDRCRKPPQWKDRWRSPQKLAKSTGAVDKPRLMGVACHLPSIPRFRQKKAEITRNGSIWFISKYIVPPQIYF